MGTLVAAAALIGIAGSPASAGTSVTSWGVSLKQGCSYASQGTFDHDGEWFRLKDVCADGWSPVMRVDVAPYSSTTNGYDFAIWNTTGNGTTTNVNKSYAEGTGVCIQAGSGEHSSGEWGSWGYWTCGTA
ncbi:hypothetical protein [Streptomyces sp. NPDC057623]|uniref:hypothetical protein n=1 Tax=Streptomyces sp. NPDC057623 TaxID=3346187 RepID=UPI003678F1E6